MPIVRALSLTLLVSLLTAAPAFADLDLEISEVIAPGDPVPGVPGGSFDSISLVDWRGEQRFVIEASIDGSPISGGLFSVHNFAISPLRLHGDPTPAGGTYADLSAATSSAGDVAVIATISGGSAAKGVFRYAEAGDGIVALEGDVASGTGGQTFAAFLDLDVNAAGDVVFTASLSGGGSSQGVFRDSGGTLDALAVSGESSPAGAPYGDFWEVVISDAGDVAFTADEEPEYVRMQVVRIGSGGPELVAWQGDPAPGSGGRLFFPEPSSGWQFPAFAGLDMGPNNELVFVASLEDCYLVHPIFQIKIPYLCSAYLEHDGALTILAGQEGYTLLEAADWAGDLGTMVKRSNLAGFFLSAGPLFHPLVTASEFELELLDGRLDEAGLLMFRARRLSYGSAYSLYVGYPRGRAIPLLPRPGWWGLGILLMAAAARLAPRRSGESSQA